MIDTDNYDDDICTAVIHSVLFDFESLRDVANRTRDPAVREELQTTLDTVLQPAVNRVVRAKGAAGTLLAAEEYADKHRLFVMEKVQGDKQERLVKRCDAMAASLRCYKRIDLRAAEQLRRFAGDLVERLDNSATVQNTGALVTQLTEYTSCLQKIINNAQQEKEAAAVVMAGHKQVLEAIEHTLRRSMEELVGPLHITRNGDEANQPGGPGTAPGNATVPEKADAPGEARIPEVAANAN
jgi:hypothetical protein